MDRAVFSIAVALVSLSLFVLPGGTGIDRDQYEPLAAPFSLDAGSGGFVVPIGSTITHLQDGVTLVTDADGDVIFRTRDDLSAPVSTPNGPRKARHIYDIPSGSSIVADDGGAGVYRDRELVLKVVVGPEPENKSEEGYSAWIQHAYNLQVKNLDTFTATWTVPNDPPAAGDNTTSYLFNGIEVYYGLAIIQPVLEWDFNRSGGWTCAAWHAWSSGGFRADPVPASAGDTIHGNMVWNGSAWDIEIENATTGQSSRLFSAMFGTENLYVFCALEGYNIRGDCDIPGDTVFEDMLLSYQGEPLVVIWEEDDDIPPGSGLSFLDVEMKSESKVVLHTAN